MGVFNPSGFITGSYDYLVGSLSTVEYLVVAGGGSGGNTGCPFVQNQGAGGGGAGGLLQGTGYVVTPGSPITVTVGAGAAASASASAAGTAGSNSVFGSLTAIGGGGGAGTYGSGGPATTGGSGGGGSGGRGGGGGGG